MQIKLIDFRYNIQLNQPQSNGSASAASDAPTADNLVSMGCFLVLFILTRIKLQEDFVKVL